MDIRRLQSFQVLARELHFGRAAATLHITQPALSQQIKLLEREIGTELFVRGSHGVTLTPAGRVLLSSGERLLREVDLVTESVKAAAAGQTGLLRVQYTRSWPDAGSHDLVHAFNREYPHVTVQADTGWTQHNIERLREGMTDVAFVRTPLINAPGINVLPIREDPLVVALPINHPLSRKVVLEPRDIHSQGVILWPRAQGPGYYDSIIGQVWGDMRPKIAIEEPDDEHILTAVASGMGIGLIGAHRAVKLCPKDVVIRHFSEPQPVTQLAIAWNADDTNPVMNRFIAVAKEFADADGTHVLSTPIPFGLAS
jgi:DNA-binding transcriptional LysR family regulator